MGCQSFFRGADSWALPGLHVPWQLGDVEKHMGQWVPLFLFCSGCDPSWHDVVGQNIQECCGMLWNVHMRRLRVFSLLPESWAKAISWSWQGQRNHRDMLRSFLGWFLWVQLWGITQNDPFLSYNDRMSLHTSIHTCVLLHACIMYINVHSMYYI